MVQLQPVQTGQIEVSPVLAGGFVYRGWDAQGQLLYVGLTDDLLARLGGHRRQGSRWLRTATLITWERYDTYDQAAAAEQRAIRAEAPRHNVRFNEQAIAARAELERRGHARDYDGDTAAWAALGVAMRAARARLRLTQTGLARDASIDLVAWRTLEAGQGFLVDAAAADYSAIETALRWMPGSLEDVLQGQPPRPLTPEARQTRLDALYGVRR